MNLPERIWAGDRARPTVLEFYLQSVAAGAAALGRDDSQGVVSGGVIIRTSCWG